MAKERQTRTREKKKKVKLSVFKQLMDSRKPKEAPGVRQDHETGDEPLAVDRFRKRPCMECQRHVGEKDHRCQYVSLVEKLINQKVSSHGEFEEEDNTYVSAQGHIISMTMLLP